jgi:AcrR family transcriptional regulator
MPICGAASISKKQAEFARREQEILQAALSLFEGPHWEQVTVEQISKKAEIGKGTVYKHFASKEEIYAYITLAFTERLFESLEKVIHHEEVLENLKQVIRVAFDVFLGNPAQARVSFYCKREDYRNRLNNELREKFEASDLRVQTFMGTLLQPGIDKGLFIDKPVEHLVMGLEATFDGAISMIWNSDVSYQHADDQETYVDIISEYMLAGLVGLSKR